MSEKGRYIQLMIEDVYAAAILGYSLPPQFISEADIAKFCNGCDFSKTEVCTKVKSNDQARYAARKGCGWAEKDGVRGSISVEGFKPYIQS